MKGVWLRNHILPYWKSYVVVLVPLFLLPLPLIAQTKVVYLVSDNNQTHMFNFVFEGSVVWLRNSCHGSLLDDRSDSISCY